MIRRARSWAALGAAGALTAGAVALPALAQDDPPSETAAPQDEATSPAEARADHHAEMDQALADVLGVSVEELQAAREEARTTVFLAHLDEQVADGRLTQEEADDLRAAAEAGTLDDALKALRLSRLEARLDEAVANGRLTQEQADTRLELAQSEDGDGHGFGLRGLPGLGGPGRGGPGFGGPGHRGHRGPGPGPWGGPDDGDATPEADGASLTDV